MGKPAARIADVHVCPKQTSDKPHVGGPILQGAPTVFIGGKPAATLGSVCKCNGPPDKVATGSRTVLIGGKPAARMGDKTAHGGSIVVGCPTVLIGEESRAPTTATLPKFQAINWIDLHYCHADGSGVAGAAYTLFDSTSNARVASGILDGRGRAHVPLPLDKTGLRAEFHSDPAHLTLFKPTQPARHAVQPGWLKRMMQGEARHA